MFGILAGNKKEQCVQRKVKVDVAQLCPTLFNPIDCTVHGILQARILEWVAIPFSRGIFPTQGSNPGLLHCRWILYQLSHKGSPRILEWVAIPFSRGIFPIQGSNPGLLHCRQILYQLSHKGSPRILVWVAYPFSSGSSQLRNGTGVSYIASVFFTNWAIREARIN